MLEMRLNNGNFKIGDDGKISVSQNVADMIRANSNGEDIPEFTVTKENNGEEQSGQQKQ